MAARARPAALRSRFACEPVVAESVSTLGLIAGSFSGVVVAFVVAIVLCVMRRQLAPAPPEEEEKLDDLEAPPPGAPLVALWSMCAARMLRPLPARRAPPHVAVRHSPLPLLVVAVGLMLAIGLCAIRWHLAPAQPWGRAHGILHSMSIALASPAA